MRIKFQFIYLILLLALIVRLWGIGSESIWVDEAYTVRMVSLDFVDFLSEIPHDVHMPLYNVLLWFWTRIFGFGEVALRSLSMIFGVVAVYFFYELSNLFSKRVAVISSLLLAVSPMAIFFSQEARLYSLFLMVTIASNYYYFSSFINKKNYLKYILWSVAMIYTHVFGFIVLGMQLIYSIIYKRKIIKNILIVVSSFVLWIPIFLNQLFMREIMPHVVPPQWIDLTDTFIIFFGGEYVQLMFFILLFIFFFLNLWKKSMIYYFSYLLIPFIIFVFSYFFVPVYSFRYLIFVIPSIYLFMGVVLDRILSINKIKYLGLLLLLLVFYFSIHSSFSQVVRVDKTPWDEIAEFVREGYSEKEIISYPEFYLMPFMYYYDRDCLLDNNCCDYGWDFIDCVNGLKGYRNEESFLNGTNQIILHNLHYSRFGDKFISNGELLNEYPKGAVVYVR